jgi:hypothetical protein
LRKSAYNKNIVFHYPPGGKMAENIEQKLDGRIEDKDAYVHNAYENAINYYRRASRNTKRSYKAYRFFSIFLGALVTLISSLAATKYVESVPLLNATFAVATPVIAASLSIITGLSQSFQWGSTWRDLTVHSQKIASERDRFLATNPEERDHKRELEILNGLLLNETESFFQRILDSQMTPFISSSKDNEAKQIK